MTTKSEADSSVVIASSMVSMAMSRVSRGLPDYQCFVYVPIQEVKRSHCMHWVHEKRIAIHDDLADLVHIVSTVTCTTN